jgi:hypothetical protein
MNSLRPLIPITPCIIPLPGCYGDVYVFRILGVIMQLY